MSRGNTIIVAVLVNAALLLILFATAIRRDNVEPSKQQVQLAQTHTPSFSPQEEDLFNQYIATTPPTLAKDESLSFAEEIELAFSPPEPLEEKKTVKVEAPKTDGKYVDVTVKKGDFLEKIASSNNTTVAAIMEANHLSSTQLKIGQVLKVPLNETKQKKSAVPAATPAEGDFYVVKEGDSPWLIASRNHIRLDELLRLNGLDDQKARRLRPGDRLRIR